MNTGVFSNIILIKHIACTIKCYVKLYSNVHRLMVCLNY